MVLLTLIFVHSLYGYAGVVLIFPLFLSFRRMIMMGCPGRRSGWCGRCFISRWRSLRAHRSGRSVTNSAMEKAPTVSHDFTATFSLHKNSRLLLKKPYSKYYKDFKVSGCKPAGKCHLLRSLLKRVANCFDKWMLYVINNPFLYYD